MTIDFGFIRKLILTSMNHIHNINKEIKDLKHDIKEELKEIKELKEKVNIEEENDVDVILVKEENEKDFCDVTLASDDVQIYILKVIPKFLFHCDKCPAKFSFKYDLTKHMWTHSVIIACSCNICQKLFSEKSELEEHMKKQTSKFSIEYFDLNVLKDRETEGRSFLPKCDQNLVFQVF